ncbi:MAG TPA: hypothetical protein VHI13_22920, partial [Candidatus Kapabacteria bacterium]|nr:hypothetical protein [Candidatus Kapabacteria bacterium]
MYRQFKILATLMLLAAACTTMHAQYSQQSFDTRKASELYDERGYQTSGAITVDGSLAISNSNGNVSYAYPISQTAVSGFSLTVSLAYCGSLSYVTYKDYASGNVYDPYARWNRFHENRPGWIISVGPFAVQVLSSNGMFHCDPAKFSGAARDSFSDRDMQWCAEGYDVCNRMENLAAETQQVQEEGYVDVISLLRGDGSVLKLYNRRDWSVDGDASMRSDLYTGYYISPEANSHGYALVSWDSAGWPEHVRDFVESRITPTYPYMPRVLRYYSGDGLEYVFHERVAANGLRSYGGAELAVPDQFGAMKAVPSIFYLEQINSTAGAIVWQIGRSRHYDPRTVTTLNQGNIFDPIFTTIHDSTVGRALTTDIGGVHITYGDIGFTIEANGRTTKAIIGRIQTNGNAPAAVNSMPLASRGYFTRTAEGLAALNETGGASSSLYEGYMGYVTEIIDPEGRSTKFTYEPYTRTYVNENYPVPNPVGTDLKLSLTNQRLKRIDEPTASYTISYAGGDINTYGDLVREDTVRAATIRADDPTNVNYPFLLNNVASVVRKYDHNGTLLTEQKCEYSHSAGDGFWKGLLTTTDKVANTSRTNTYLYRIHPMPDSIRIVWEPKPRYTELYHTEESGAGVTTVTTTTTEQMPCSPYVWLPTHTETSVAGITTSRRTFSYGFDTARTYGGDARLTRLFGIETKRSITRTLDPATSALRLVDTTDFVHMPMLDTTLWRLDTFLNKFATLGNYFRLRDSGVIRGPWEWAMYDPRVAVFTLDSAYEHAYVPPHYGLVARDVLADSSGGILGGMQTEYTGAQATIRHVNDLLYRGMPARSFVISAGGTSTVLASGRLFSNTNGMDVPIVDTNANGAVHRDFYESYGSLKLRQNGNYYPRASVLRNDGTTKDTLLPEDSYFSVLFNKPLINEVYVRKYDPSGSGLLMTDTMLQLHQYGFFGLATG